MRYEGWGWGQMGVWWGGGGGVCVCVGGGALVSLVDIKFVCDSGRY